MGTFWSAGWRGQPQWPGPQEMGAAVRAGVMFAEPRLLDHDGWVHAARMAAGSLTAGEVGEAFLASLASRRLDLRSALGSYAIARHLPGHAFTIPQNLTYQSYAPVGPTDCAVCGFRGWEAKPLDLNVFSFERFKWGGVRRHSVPYLAFDLEQFVRGPRLRPTPADIGLARRLLDHLAGLPARTTAAQAVAGLTFIKGNKHERANILEILGVTGILQTSGHPGHTDAYIPAAERHLPGHRFVFGDYPIWWWTAADGVNSAAVRQFLPQL
jgi:hypothetical protein